MILATVTMLITQRDTPQGWTDVQSYAVEFYETYEPDQSDMRHLVTHFLDTAEQAWEYADMFRTGESLNESPTRFGRTADSISA